ncbi:NUDIX hydrolase [Roseovarius nanhaiticus]|uniref:NUDIX hydrolase n=1 Tax=Roseovarius nanhaiticus TaxID=573024 RepID=UPI002490B989|nr:NUDIX hydrolase [Roseovarius nanhaiticus]
MIRRVGQPPQRGQSYRLRHGVYALLPIEGGLLVTLQHAPEPELQLPGGGIDPGESPLRALFREVMEETGWSIAAPQRIGAFRRFVFMPEYDMWAEKLCAVYSARPVRQICDPTEPGHTPVVIDVATAVRDLGNEGDRMFVNRWARSA